MIEKCNANKLGNVGRQFLINWQNNVFFLSCTVFEEF